MGHETIVMAFPLDLAPARGERERPEDYAEQVTVPPIAITHNQIRREDIRFAAISTTRRRRQRHEHFTPAVNLQSGQGGGRSRRSATA